jgi:hypothetical protein
MKDINKAIQIFWDLFKGREDVHGSYRSSDGETKGFQVKKAITKREIEMHLFGQVPLGVYPLLNDNTTNWICVDFDDPDFKPILDFYNRCKHYQITPAIEVSKSKGYHAWIFFDKLIPAAKARLVVHHILNELELSKVEVFPKQDRLSDATQYGNFVNLPLFAPLVKEGRTVFLDMEDGYEPYPEQFEFLKSITKVSETKIDEIIDINKLKSNFNQRPASEANEMPFREEQKICIQRLMQGVGQGERNKAACRLADHLRKKNLPLDLAEACLIEWNIRNQPPLDQNELKRTVESIHQGNYDYGCNDPFLQRYCNDNCIFKHTPQRPGNHLRERIEGIPQDTPREEIFQALRPVLEDLANLSELDQDAYVDMILEHFQGHTDLSKRSLKNDIKKIQAQTMNQGQDIEVLGEGYTKISSALDFVRGVGYVTIFLDARDGTDLVSIPYLVTSSGEFFELDKSKLFQEKRLILKSDPGSSKDNRWEWDYINEFRNGFEPDASGVFEEVRRMYDKYVDFNEPGTAEVLSLWTLGTYLHPLFESYPYISLIGTKASGKSKTTQVAEKLCFNAIGTCDISSAALYRSIEGLSATLIIDEAETLNDPESKQDLRSILNAGYKKGARVRRCENLNNRNEVKEFEVYSPKMIAGIRGLYDILESRCIQISMLRTNNLEKSNRVVTERKENWAYLRHLLYSFALRFFKEIENIYSVELESEIKDIEVLAGRNGELWFPLLSIAKFLDRRGYVGLFDRIKDFAMKKADESRAESLSPWDEALILALFHVTLGKETGITTSDIKSWMLGYLGGQENLKDISIGNALKRFGFRDKKKINGRRVYSIKHQAVLDVMRRYNLEVDQPESEANPKKKESEKAPF